MINPNKTSYTSKPNTRNEIALARLEKYSNPQQAAIFENKKQILVSAAAGSGKTTVMIERILRLLSEGVNIDEMIICTFTKSSASDMRKKLLKKLYEEDDKDWAKRAIEDLPLAELSTIASLSSRLARNYFFYVNLDPRFEVLEESIAKSMLQLSIQEIITEKLDEGDERVSSLLFASSARRYSKNLFEMLEKLYEFAFIQPDPKEWLKSLSKKTLLGNMQKQQLIELGINDNDLVKLVDPKFTKDDVSLLAELVLLIAKRYIDKKQLRSMLDFNDIEHTALSIAKNPEAREVFNKKFKYVFVDEFQDISPLQNTLIECFTGNKFFVGDIKQSIYRFRLADPDIFISYRNKFKKEENNKKADSLLITLKDNYRSDANLLNFCNDIFSSIMTTDFGGENFERDGLFSASRGQLHKISVEATTIRLEDSKSEGITPTGVYSVETHIKENTWVKKDFDAEITAISSHILSLLETKFVDIENNNKTRKVSFGDITILLRGLNDSRGFAKALFNKMQTLNIPFCVVGENEINDNKYVLSIVNFLRLVDCIDDDIVLAAVLKTEIGGNLTDGDLLKIRLFERESNKGIPFYAVTKYYSLNGDDKELMNKLSSFFIAIEKFRLLSASLSFAQMASKIAADYKLFKQAAISGIDKTDELAQFLDSLFTLDKRMSLAASLQAIDKGAIKIQKNSSPNAVQILTMHKSKGLEMPFVILANLSHGFNMQDFKKDLIVDKDIGAALKFYNVEGGQKSKTYQFELAKRILEIKSLEEEMRLLYVALTRGIYQVALFSTIDNKYKELDDIKKAKSFNDWLYSYMLKRGVERNEFDIFNDDSKTALANPLDVVDTRKIDIPEVVGLVKKQLNFVYPYKSETLKTSATERARLESVGIETTDVLQKTTMLAVDQSSVDIGNAYHELLEMIDFDLSDKDISKKILELEKTKPNLINLVNKTKLKNAVLKLKSHISSQKHYKEVSYFFRHSSGVLEQGIIDLLIERKDGYEIVDYKTGVLTVDKKVTYKNQLNIYAAATQEILKKPVVRKTLFMLSNQEFIVI